MSRGTRLTVIILAALSLVVLIAGAIYWHSLSGVRSQYFAERSGSLDSAELASVQGEPGEIVENVTLTSSSGLRVDARVRRPATSTVSPVVIIIGGHRTGRHATDLVDGLAGIAFVAIDYPYQGSVDVYGFADAIEILPQVQRAFIDTPPALLLTLRWLLRQDWVDHGQIEIAGVSLGVPFAAAAAAQDTRFSRVWLIHGGLNNHAWTEYALRRHIDNDWLRASAAKILLHLVNGASFDTLHWIRRIQPRPVVVIAAGSDERVPMTANSDIEALAGDELIEWIATDGRHIGPGREHELGQLLQIVKERVNATAKERHAR